MEKCNYQNQDTELDVKGILLQLAIGFAMGLVFLAVCGLGELVSDMFYK